MPRSEQWHRGERLRGAALAGRKLLRRRSAAPHGSLDGLYPHLYTTSLRLQLTASKLPTAALADARASTAEGSVVRTPEEGGRTTDRQQPGEVSPPGGQRQRHTAQSWSRTWVGTCPRALARARPEPGPAFSLLLRAVSVAGAVRRLRSGEQTLAVGIGAAVGNGVRHLCNRLAAASPSATKPVVRRLRARSSALTIARARDEAERRASPCSVLDLLLLPRCCNVKRAEAPVSHTMHLALGPRTRTWTCAWIWTTT